VVLPVLCRSWGHLNPDKAKRHLGIGAWAVAVGALTRWWGSPEKAHFCAISADDLSFFPKRAESRVAWGSGIGGVYGVGKMEAPQSVWGVQGPCPKKRITGGPSKRAQNPVAVRGR